MSQSVSDAFRVADLPEMDAEQSVNALLKHAADLRASDLFFLSEQRSVLVSIRRLGIVENVAVLPVDKGRQLISHCKAMAGMDITEHRRPLDGRWLHRVGEKMLDIRVNMIATLFGEDLTLRVWDREVGLMPRRAVGTGRP